MSLSLSAISERGNVEYIASSSPNSDREPSILDARLGWNKKQTVALSPLPIIYQLPSRFEPWTETNNGCHLPDNIFKWIFLNENIWISFTISLKFVLRLRINNIPSLDQKMAWRRPGDKPLSEPIMASLLTHIYASLGLNEFKKMSVLNSPWYCKKLEKTIVLTFDLYWLTALFSREDAVMMRPIKKHERH